MGGIRGNVYAFFQFNTSCVNGATNSCGDDHEGVDLPSLSFDDFYEGVVFVSFGFNGWGCEFVMCECVFYYLDG